jgi:hypothetical protein
MQRLNLELAQMRLQVEVEGLQRQLDDAQGEAKLLRQAAILDAADCTAQHRELKKQHQQQLEAQQQRHAEQLAEAVAAERDRLRASVGPVLSAMQLQQERLVQEAELAKQLRDALEAELAATRQLVFEALHDPEEVRLRLGL